MLIKTINWLTSIKLPRTTTNQSNSLKPSLLQWQESQTRLQGLTFTVSSYRSNPSVGVRFALMKGTWRDPLITFKHLVQTVFWQLVANISLSQADDTLKGCQTTFQTSRRQTAALVVFDEFWEEADVNFRQSWEFWEYAYITAIKRFEHYSVLEHPKVMRLYRRAQFGHWWVNIYTF